ncbi:MAG TPA: S41 family peptidase [Bacteroidales bacterium]|nr:S41 family peptidase [Bacteroidales bacterium]
MIKNQAKRVVFFLIILLTTITVAPAQTKDQSFEILKNLDIFATVIKELNTNYVDDINPGELTKTGIDAMLESLDPYTVYIPESEIEDYKFITTGEYGGIGALIHQQGDYVVISEPYEGSPAQKAGLQAGDKVLEINGQSAKGKSYADVSSILKGQAGTTIDVKIQRDGVDQPFTLTITREVIRIDNVPYSGIIGQDIGYIKLTSFTQNAATEVKKAFLKLKETGPVNGLIIDIRGNGGGLLNEAVDISNLFVEKGTEIVTTKGKLEDKNHTYRTMNGAVDLTIPVVILVDNESASASEILSGSLQDLDRGVVIGQRTFGKGLVQNVIPLSYNSQMKVTVAKYYIPSGRCIQAIDYSHRNKEGNAVKIPDSLITAFKTKNGRTVYEGRGITPDIQTRPVHYSNIAMALYSKYLIFDYATKFHREHASIPPADQFQITDDIYHDFVLFLAGKDYNYTTRSEQDLEDLRKNAEKEKYFDAIKGEYDALKTRMDNDKKGDLVKHQDQIRQLLKIEIVSRYYYQKGKVSASLGDDDDVSRALAVLHNAEQYKSVLNGTYKQPADELKDIDPDETDITTESGGEQ